MGNKGEVSLWFASMDATVRDDRREYPGAGAWLGNILRVLQAEGTDTRDLSSFALEVARTFQNAYGPAQPMDTTLAYTIAMINARLDMYEAYTQRAIGDVYIKVIQMLESHGFKGISRFVTVPRELPNGYHDLAVPPGEDLSDYVPCKIQGFSEQLRDLQELSLLANTAFLYLQTNNLEQILAGIPYHGPRYAPAMRAGVRDYCISPSVGQLSAFEVALQDARLKQFGSYMGASGDVTKSVFSRLYLPTYGMASRALEWAVNEVSRDHGIPNRSNSKPVYNVQYVLDNSIYLQHDPDRSDANSLPHKVDSLAPGLNYACMNVCNPLRRAELGIPDSKKHEVQAQAQCDAILVRYAEYEKQMQQLIGQ